jgi:anti-sigma B factor antagonist
VAGFTSFSNAEGRLKLVGLTRRVKELLQMTQVLSIFEAIEDEATAVRSYAEEIGK